MKQRYTRTVSVLIAAMLALGLGLAFPAAGMAAGTPPDLEAVWASDPAHVWAVGSGGSVMFYNGQRWAAQASGTNEILTDVSGVDSRHVWAVGNNGTILFYNGAAWARQACARAQGKAFMGVSALDATHVWAVTLDAYVFYFNGRSWEQQWHFMRANLWDVSAYRAADGSPAAWAIPVMGMQLFSYGAGRWTAVDTWRVQWLYSVFALDETHAWAAGPLGILSLDDGEWVEEGIPTDKWLIEVHAADPNNVWAVGEDGTMLTRWAGGWCGLGARTRNDLNGVFVLDNDRHDAWAVGDAGTIIHFSDFGCSNVTPF